MNWSAFLNFLTAAVVFLAGYFAGKENVKQASWLEARKYEIDKQAEMALTIARETISKKNDETTKEDK